MGPVAQLVEGIGFEVQFLGQGFHAHAIQAGPNQVPGAVRQLGDAIEQVSDSLLIEFFRSFCKSG